MRRMGFATYHAHDSRRQIAPERFVGDLDARGFPDIIAVRPPRILAIELKSEKGRLRPEQRGWLDLLERVPGVEVHVWCPADWENVVEILL